MDESVISRLNGALEGRYSVERQLGEGGMATVYLADDLRHERRVALKVLKPELAAVVGAERFLAEIRVTANLQHPNILPLFDSGEADTFLYYVMPYVEGETLRDRLLRDRQLPVDEAVRMAIEIAEALDHAHRQGVIHRDIKPANILLRDGRPVVADFGIALAVGAAGGARLTETGLSVGTPYYMSPEQATGDQHVGPQSDTYSLACVLYEMLVGDPPYQGSTAQAVLGKIIQGEVVSATRQRPAIPPHVDAAIRRALERLPADRFSGAQDFGRALADPSFRHGADAAAAAGASTGWRRVAVGAIAGMVVLAAGWAWTALGGDEAGVERQRITLGSGFTDNARFALALFTALSPDGSDIVFHDTIGGESLWWKQGDQADANRLDVNGFIPMFSPDGQWLAFFEEDDLRKQPVTGGASVALAEVIQPANSRPALAWLEDGTIIYEDRSFSLWRISEDGGEPRQLATEADVGRPLKAVGLPGGGAVLVVGCSLEDGAPSPCPPGRPVLSLVDLDTHTVHQLLDDVAGAWPGPDGHIVYTDVTGAVFAAPLDRDAGELGPPVPLMDGVVASVNASEMQVSRDGTLLYLRGESAETTGFWRLVWVNRSGVREPVDPESSGDDIVDVALSPDGRRVVARISRSPDAERLWVKQLPDGPLTPLTDGVIGAIRPTWSPDGSYVYYRGIEGGSNDARRIPADGSRTEAEVVATRDKGVYEVLPLNADDQLLIREGISLATERAADIVRVELGSNVTSTPVVVTPANEFAFSLSPDERWIAYVSDVSGQNEVFVQALEGGGRTQVSTGGAVEPVWARTGDEIFYRDAEGWMVSASIGTDPTFFVENRARLFNTAGLRSVAGYRAYDATADAQRFLMIEFIGAGTAGDLDLILVKNWFEEVKERIGG